MFGWKTAKQEVSHGVACMWCRKTLPGSTGAALSPATLREFGAVHEAGAGWFCDRGCASQYTLRFRISPIDVALPVARRR